MPSAHEARENHADRATATVNIIDGDRRVRRPDLTSLDVAAPRDLEKYTDAVATGRSGTTAGSASAPTSRGLRMSIRVYGRSCDRCGRITTTLGDDRWCRQSVADESEIRAHLTAALDELPLTPLIECPVCTRQAVRTDRCARLLRRLSAAKIWDFQSRLFRNRTLTNRVGGIAAF